MMTEGCEEPYFELHEVFYKNKHIPRSYTANAITIGADDATDFPEIVCMISEACNKPILYKGDKFPQEYGILKSRCCGRCDGNVDICVTDDTCEKHGIIGCENCFGKKTTIMKY